MKGDLLRAVRSHLARPAQGAVSEHPDANLLAAFAENALSKRERTAVTRHLADCADCREMLALAFAHEEEEEPLAVPAQPVRRWFPVWSWAASAAAVCIVCSAVWEYRLQRGVIAPPPPPPAPAIASAPMPASPAAPMTAASNAVAAVPGAFKPPVPQPASPRQVEAPPPPPQVAEAAPAPKDALRQVQDKPAPAPPPPYQSPGVQQALAAQRPSQQWAAQAGQPAPAPMRAASGFAMPRSAIAGAVMKKSAPRDEAVASASHALWTIASEDHAGGPPRGIVQRSLDEGATWQTVYIDERVSFRAIASDGADVWAGGDGGALFRSSDAGEHWHRVSFPVPATITAIQLSDNGEIHVTAGQVWISRDGAIWTTD